MQSQLKQIETVKNLMSTIDTVKPYMGTGQRFAVAQALNGEESGYFVEVIERLSNIIETMPRTYQTEETPTEEKIVHLHLFRGGMDFYIVELDMEDEQLQAYGYRNIGFGYSWGYINICELVENHVELDFHFDPIKFGELKQQVEPETDEE